MHSSKPLDTVFTARSRANRIRKRLVDRVRRLREAAGTRPTMVDQSLRIEHHVSCVIRAWEELAEHLPRVATALELHYFGGLEVEGVAAAMGRSLNTGAVDLRFGHAYLAKALQPASLERRGPSLSASDAQGDSAGSGAVEGKLALT